MCQLRTHLASIRRDFANALHCISQWVTSITSHWGRSFDDLNERFRSAVAWRNRKSFCNLNLLFAYFSTVTTIFESVAAKDRTLNDTVSYLWYHTVSFAEYRIFLVSFGGKKKKETFPDNTRKYFTSHYSFISLLFSSISKNVKTFFPLWFIFLPFLFPLPRDNFLPLIIFFPIGVIIFPQRQNFASCIKPLSSHFFYFF